MIGRGKVPYCYPVLRIPEGRSGNLSIVHKVIRAGHSVMLNSPRAALFGRHQDGPGSLVYDHDTVWHNLNDEEFGTWMTDLPIEQRQIDHLLDGMRGSVLVGGLGLGYALEALATKRLVHEVVVVERSQHVADLVWPHVSTAAKAKTRLVVADLFDYLRDTDRNFTYGFYDIWQADSETEFHNTIVPLRWLSGGGRVSYVRCWNEDVMRGQLMHGLASKVAMLSAPAQSGLTAKDFGVDLDRLADVPADASIYQRWQAPFWQWFRKEQPEVHRATHQARIYANAYDGPEGTAPRPELVLTVEQHMAARR